MKRYWPLKVFKVAAVATLALGVVGFSHHEPVELARAGHVRRPRDRLLAGAGRCSRWPGCWSVACAAAGTVAAAGGVHMQARWNEMGDDERARFRERFGRRCGPRRDAAGGQPA